MPPTRHVASDILAPVCSSTQHFSIPNDHHLLITTPSRICAWDRVGFSTVFSSSKSGIVAAREANDGSGILAVADKYVVVLHDTKRGQERSWGLAGDEDKVRHLEYAQDAQCLFLSTNLTSDIQRYSTQRSRLLSPMQVQANPSAPIALAVSSNGRWVVSASDHPPTIYIKDLEYNSTPILLEPRASQAAVSVAAFHPRRSHVLLLAFRDGALAAYDTTKISRKAKGDYLNQEAVNDGEISRFTGLHRTTSKTMSKKGITGKAATITGAAFLPGYKTRAISVGSDGRVRLVDFSEGGVILRTWHVKASLTSVCVLSERSSPDAHDGKAGRDPLIAVGRVDGKVHIYDSVGLMLAQKTVSENGERIIGIEWVKGSSPRPIAVQDVHHEPSDTPAVPLRKLAVTSPPAAEPGTPKAQPTKDSTPQHLGLPPALRRPDLSHPTRSARKNTQFVIHPDEVEGTVRRTPAPARTSGAPIGVGQYADLFSPVKAANDVTGDLGHRQAPTSPRNRPRLSSQTFVKSPILAPLTETVRPLSTVKPASGPARESHATSSGSGTARPTVASRMPKRRADDIPRVSTHISPLRRRRPDLTAASQAKAGPVNDVANATVPASDNAKILAGLRRMGGAAPPTRPGNVIAAMPRTGVHEVQMFKKPALADHPAHRSERKGPARQKYWHPGNVLERESTWPTDSVQDESLHEYEDDIWLTEESDQEAKHLRRRRLAPIRPPGRQTSRSRVDENGTMSTVQAQVASAAAQPRAMDGSTEDDKYATAYTSLSPDGAFSPASEQVRQLFPRASSLSPARKHSSSKERTDPSRQVLGMVPEPRVLQEVPGNATLKRQAKSPWVKAKAKKQQAVHSDSNLRFTEKESQAPGPLVRSPGFRCLDCARVEDRVAGLTNEVSRLKVEVLALKTALRGSGVPLPPTLRSIW